MTTETKKIIYCIHGMISITCNLCKDKTEEKIADEINFVKEDMTRSLMYDYQDIELPNTENIEDLDFDMDDMSS